MAHSYKRHFFHLIWSTKNRLNLISPEIQSHLYPYLGAIIRNYEGKLLEIGGMPDHVHLLIDLAGIDKFTYFLRDLKACSSQWMHKTFPNIRDFAWQEGYGSFSVSYSSLNLVKLYIRNQEAHHSSMSFDDEYRRMLTLHGLEYDERFVLG